MTFALGHCLKLGSLEANLRLILGFVSQSFIRHVLEGEIDESEGRGKGQGGLGS